MNAAEEQGARTRPVAIAFASHVEFIDGHAVVTKTLNTPFTGANAKGRCLGFIESSREDFTERDGWVWHKYVNDAAAQEWSDNIMASLAP